MRVIAGKCRSLSLKAPEGLSTRPTTDRIKETLFNVLQPYIPGSRFLDLFSGSGAIGIEALSRGAEHALFCDSDPASIKVIKENLSFTRLDKSAEVVKADVLRLIETSKPAAPFDIIYLDPPYGKKLEIEAMTRLAGSAFVGNDTIYVIEAEKNEDMSFISDLGLTVFKEKIYKTNKHIFARAEINGEAYE